MWIMPDVYNDDIEVVEYLWRNHKGKDGIYLVALEKAIEGNSDLHRQLITARAPELSKYFNWSLVDIKADWAKQRLLSGVIVNRCPKCKKVMISEASRQCLYCNHDWH